MFQLPEGGTHGEGLKVKGKQDEFQVQYDKPSCRGLQEQEGAVQCTSRGPEKQGFFSFGSFQGAIGGLGLQRVHTEGQGFDQGPRLGIQHRQEQCQRESKKSGS